VLSHPLISTLSTIAIQAARSRHELIRAHLWVRGLLRHLPEKACLDNLIFFNDHEGFNEIFKIHVIPKIKEIFPDLSVKITSSRPWMDFL
jgi:hypothetical protein